jgi:hypothetical protein
VQSAVSLGHGLAQSGLVFRGGGLGARVIPAPPSLRGICALDGGVSEDPGGTRGLCSSRGGWSACMLPCHDSHDCGDGKHRLSTPPRLRAPVTWQPGSCTFLGLPLRLDISDPTIHHNQHFSRGYYYNSRKFSAARFARRVDNEGGVCVFLMLGGPSLWFLTAGVSEYRLQNVTHSRAVPCMQARPRERASTQYEGYYESRRPYKFPLSLLHWQDTRAAVPVVRTGSGTEGRRPG